jgi:hypothetical protein
MVMPGFAAETSLYPAREALRSSASKSPTTSGQGSAYTHVGEQAVIPQRCVCKLCVCDPGGCTCHDCMCS